MGERRRVDLALLLALGEVARAAAGVGRATLFFDEALDNLDALGVQGAVDAIAELAATHAVVVISHNPALLQGLRPTAQIAYQVQQGEFHSW
jgi:DNA repair exonuclease SbcCD ATPase subunit